MLFRSELLKKSRMRTRIWLSVCVEEGKKAIGMSGGGPVGTRGACIDRRTRCSRSPGGITAFPFMFLREKKSLTKMRF